MLRIAVCDDNAESVKRTEQLLDSWPSRPFHTLCQYFSNGDDLVSAHNANPFDIILLDIIMPLVNGIDTAREIRQTDRNVKIIFLSSSSEFAVESYKVKASNYLLKPLDSKDFYDSLDEIVQDSSRKVRTVTVKGLYSIHRIPLDNIEYIEAQNKHILYVLLDGTVIEAPGPLYVHENSLRLTDGFFKCHRSYIVNINYIDTYTTKEVRMQSGGLIPISRSFHKDFEKAYFSVLFGKAGESRG